MTTAHETIRAAVDELGPRLLEISAQLHANPELAFSEHASAALLADELRGAGFDVQLGAYGLDTAIEATYGTGEFVVAVCAEYDALPGIGHACGHNVIASAGLGAALALARVADELGITVRLLGTPAEEHGGGKVLMLEAGAWEDVTVSLMVHGGPEANISCADSGTQALDRFDVEYTGKAAHAAAAPHEGVNAADAATIALTAIGLLRQQLHDSIRVAAYVEHGGDATNIIPARTLVRAEVRGLDSERLEDAWRRVMNCFEAGAIATGCSWKHVRAEPRYVELRQDPDLAAAWDDAMRAVGRDVQPRAVRSIGGSTDMGNVSHVVPSIHPMIGIAGCSAPPHTIDFATAAATAGADQAALDGAYGLAIAAATVAADPETRASLLARQAAREPGATTISQDGTTL